MILSRISDSPKLQKGTKLARGKIVLATGAFDLLHLGHVRFLEASKRKGGPGAKLIVVVARDKTVLNRKGRSDKAILGHTHLDLLGILREVRPDIISVGYDQKQIKASVEKLLRVERLPIRVIQIPKFGPSGLNSSTGIKQRVAKGWATQTKPRRSP
ncbi:hypothetical protein E6H17_07090 [Candidatus Bathyarchaeota archaeon]|nr:MAG: hypothetical protein E6H17_07090 [Candidatus Bathyarchaeota archaeon]